MTKRFNINDYKGQKVCMHCPKLWQAAMFTLYLHDNNRCWHSGRGYNETTHWAAYKSVSCYYFNESKIGRITDEETQKSYTILKFEDFDWEGM